MPFISMDRSFFDKVVAGEGRAPRDIHADAAAEFTTAEGERAYAVLYPFDRGVVHQLLSDARDIVWHYTSATFQGLFPEFFPIAAVP